MRSFLVFCVALLPLLARDAAAGDPDAGGEVRGAIPAGDPDSGGEVRGAAPAGDPCAAIAGKNFVAPADARACLKSFPFNETLRQNVLTNVGRIFDSFYTFEDFYLNSPRPFQESTANIRARLNQINSTKYKTDYDFNIDLYDFITQLNDGHTRWLPDCYMTFQNILPAPLVAFGEKGVFVSPDSVEFLSQLGPEFTDYLTAKGFNWQRLAGAKFFKIEGLSPFDYVDLIATNVSGNYLDHGVRVNSVFSSYRISGTSFSQRLGDAAGPVNVKQNALNVQLVTKGSRVIDTLNIPFVASYIGLPFTDKASFWAANCAANDATNGVDLKDFKAEKPVARKRPRAVIFDRTAKQAIALPPPFLPNTTAVPGSEGVIKSFILPDQKTGVMFVGTFEGDFDGFQSDVVQAINSFKAANVTQVLIDLTNNGGGFLCLGLFLHQYFAGSKIGYPGFESTNRATPFAQKIVAADIALGLNVELTSYTADNWAFLNGTLMPASFNYLNPSAPFTVNGVSDPTSQRFHDISELFFSQPIPADPPFDLNNVAIVSNGNCASTCAVFSTLMFERHNTKIAVFGGRPGQQMEYKGMAGNQVLEWTDIDTEIKTAGLKDDPLAPPDLLVSADMRHNWRTAWSFRDEHTPIAYESELPTLRFDYTEDTYNNPQALWAFAATQLFN